MEDSFYLRIRPSLTALLRIFIYTDTHVWRSPGYSLTGRTRTGCRRLTASHRSPVRVVMGLTGGELVTDPHEGRHNRALW